MGNVVAVDDIALTCDEVSDVGGEFTNPDTVASCGSTQTSRIITVDVRVFIIAKSVHFIRLGLSNASCGVGPVDELAWERLSMALSGGEVVIIVIEARVESTVGWRDS